MSSSVRLNDDNMILWKEAGYEHVDGTLLPQPMEQPKFTLTELRNAVPAHCFERSIVKSCGYLALDIVIITSLLCCAYVLLEMQDRLPVYCQFFGYAVYWFCQGSFMFGLWVLAHECGELLTGPNIDDFIHKNLRMTSPYFSEF